MMVFCHWIKKIRINVANGTKETKSSTSENNCFWFPPSAFCEFINLKRSREQHNVAPSTCQFYASFSFHIFSPLHSHYLLWHDSLLLSASAGGWSASSSFGKSGPTPLLMSNAFCYATLKVWHADMSIRFRLNNFDCEGYLTHAQEEMDCGNGLRLA